jgi:hypothetical protein
MTRYRRRALVLAVLASAGPWVFPQSKPSQSISVSDARQLVDAIGPDRTIVLKKGDYLLSTAYEMKTAYVSWNDGKELSLANLRNLTIRGAEGARILSDSNLSAIIGIYDSSNVTFDDIRFVRLLKTGSDVGAGSVYAESVQGLTLDRCSFEGPTTIAIELWKCVDATIRRSLVSGAVSRALSASYTRGLELGASRVSNCEGHPLIYLRSSDNVSIKGTAFEGSTGGNFIEIYAESGSVEAVRFEGSSFRGNQVQYFAGTSILPTTEDCLFADNSFDENWASDSVAPANGSSTNDDRDEETEVQSARYDHSSGLSFSYPQGWEMQEYSAQSRAGVFAPDGRSLVFFEGKVHAMIGLAAEADSLDADSDVDGIFGSVEPTAGLPKIGLEC